MSDSDEEPYSTIFASLKHPIRRRILRMLSKKPMSFSEMLEVLGVSSSFLTYHLENLGELVGKMDDGKYKLSSFGEAAMATMTKAEDISTTVPQQSAEDSETRSHKWSGHLGIITRKFKMDETKPKKVVRRSAAIALGIICILLIGFIAYFSITGISAQNSYNNLQNQNKQLQTWLNENVSQNVNLQNQNSQLQTWLAGNETLFNQTQANNTNLQSQIDSLNSNITNLQNEVNNFHISGTENSTVLFNNENVGEETNSSTGWVQANYWGFYTSSAGYVSIRVSSNNNSTYVALFHLLNSTTLWWNRDYQISVGFGGTVVFPVLPTSMIGIHVGNSFGEATQTVVTITYYY